MLALLNSKPIKVLAMAGLCVGLTTACKTNQGWQKDIEVDIQETSIMFPDELMKLKGFKIKSAKIKEDGSFRREVVNFTGGYFSYDRYFLGGMLAVSPHSFRKMLDKYYKDFTIDGDVTKTSAAIGDIYYATLHGKGLTCIVMSGNYGTSMMLRSGPGYPGQTDGEYCEKGTVAGLTEKALMWMKRIRLRS
ncbi:hypothetical protein [Magnetovibrio sp.]|uniref:hypothetical protein n=1 Tax=Magnetovibrio sp. TaxID=2024836 RepID=UPI002F9317EB